MLWGLPVCQAPLLKADVSGSLTPCAGNCLAFWLLGGGCCLCSHQYDLFNPGVSLVAPLQTHSLLQVQHIDLRARQSWQVA